MNRNELKARTKEFAHRCVRVAGALPQNLVAKIISGQLIRSSTSVAANYRAACLAQSKKTFIAKLSIVIEECDETEFWLEFIIEEKLLKEDLVESLLNEAHQLTSSSLLPEKLQAPPSSVFHHKSSILNEPHQSLV